MGDRSRVILDPGFHRIGLPSCLTLTLSTPTTCLILMQILATVQRSALSNQSKSQLNTSVGTYLDRYLEVQSTQPM
jgi:hypothetical protein